MNANSKTLTPISNESKARYMATQTESVLRSFTEYQTPAQNFKCPFHNEQHGASMKYYPESQTMRCFGKCGRSYNVFDLLAIQQGIDPQNNAAVWQEVALPALRGELTEAATAQPKRAAKPANAKPPAAEPKPLAVEYVQAPAPDRMGATVLYRYSASFYMFRWDYPKQDGEKKGRKVMRPYRWIPNDGWRRGDPKGLLPLYNLAELLAHPARPVLIVEGEKDCEAARLFLGHEFVVTTWAHGTCSTHKTAWQPLQNRNCYLWPDHDEAGIKAAYAISDILENIGAKVTVFFPTGATESGEGAADFLEVCEGNTLEAYDHFKLLLRENRHIIKENSND